MYVHKQEEKRRGEKFEKERGQDDGAISSAEQGGGSNFEACETHELREFVDGLRVLYAI